MICFSDMLFIFFLTLFCRLQPNCVAKVICVENLKKVREMPFFLPSCCLVCAAFKLLKSVLPFFARMNSWRSGCESLSINRCFWPMLQVVFFAKRDIYAKEEITYDYKFNCDEVGDKIPCFCGTPECRGTLN